MADEVSWFRKLSQICHSARAYVLYAYAYTYALVKTRLKVSSHDLHWETKHTSLRGLLTTKLSTIYAEKSSPQ